VELFQILNASVKAGYEGIAFSGSVEDEFGLSKNSKNTATPAQLINDHGIHLMTRVYWGGAAEFNYAYTGTEPATTADIKAALNASYAGFSGSAGTELQQKANELNEHSTFTSSFRGGDNSTFTLKDDFDSRYVDWVQSVQNKPDICGIPNFDKDLLPLRELAAELDSDKAAGNPGGI
jgi:hypothetical protein